MKNPKQREEKLAARLRKPGLSAQEVVELQAKIVKLHGRPKRKDKINGRS